MKRWTLIDDFFEYRVDIAVVEAKDESSAREQLFAILQDRDKEHTWKAIGDDFYRFALGYDGDDTDMAEGQWYVQDLIYSELALCSVKNCLLENVEKELDVVHPISLEEFKNRFPRKRISGHRPEKDIYLENGVILYSYNCSPFGICKIDNSEDYYCSIEKVTEYDKYGEPRKYEVIGYVLQ